jgi:hypothetical protein
MNTKFKEYQIPDYDGMLRFITGGSAIFTIKNEKSGNRFTYKFKQNQGDPSVFWVYMLCLSNNDDQKSYKFLGGFSQQKGFLNSQSAQIKGTMGVMAIEWWCKSLLIKNIPKTVKMYHLSKCGRCGKSLTNPDSIISGFGPECLKQEVKEGNTQPVKYLEQQDNEFNNSIKGVEMVESMIPVASIKAIEIESFEDGKSKERDQNTSKFQRIKGIKVFLSQLKLKLFDND